MLQTKVVQKIKTRIFLRKSYRLWKWNFCPDRFALPVFSALRSACEQNVVSGVCIWYSTKSECDSRFFNTIWYQHLTTNCSAVRELRLLSFGLWRRVVGWVLPDVSKNRGVSVTGSWSKQYSSLDDWPWRRRLYDRLKQQELLTHRHLVARSTIPLREPQMSPCSQQTDTHDRANRGISANFCCKRSENITLRGAVLCVFKVANMASERNLQVMSEGTPEWSWSWQGKLRDWFIYLTLWSSFEYRV